MLRGFQYPKLANVIHRFIWKASFLNPHACAKLQAKGGLWLKASLIQYPLDTRAFLPMTIWWRLSNSVAPSWASVK